MVSRRVLAAAASRAWILCARQADGAAAASKEEGRGGEAIAFVSARSLRPRHWIAAARSPLTALCLPLPASSAQPHRRRGSAAHLRVAPLCPLLLGAMIRLSGAPRPSSLLPSSMTRGVRAQSPSRQRKGPDAACWRRVGRRVCPARCSDRTVMACVPLTFCVFALLAVAALVLLSRPASVELTQQQLWSEAAGMQVASAPVRPKIVTTHTHASNMQQEEQTASLAAAPALPSLLDSPVAVVASAPPPAASSRSVSSASVRRLSAWLSLRSAMDALSLDLSEYFPKAAPPEPIRLSNPMARVNTRSLGRPYASTPPAPQLFYPPSKPAPKQQGWAAGLPHFPELFLRDAFVSFLLLFPLPRPRDASGEEPAGATTADAPPPHPGYEGPWDPLTAPFSGPTVGSAVLPPRVFPFPRLLDAHPSVASTALDDLARMRSVLRVAATTQGTKPDPRTGEESGKIAHQLPGKDVFSAPARPKEPQRVRNTRFSASDSTALFVLASVHHFHASSDLSLLAELLPALSAAYAYLVRHIEPATGLVHENPAKFLDPDSTDSDRGIDFALKVTMWKDSILMQRAAQHGGAGGPAYPVSYFLLQAQTLAALRALRSLRFTLAAFVPSDASADSMPMAAVLRRWDALLASSASPDLDSVIARVRSAIHTYYFGRTHTDDAVNPSAPAASEFPFPTARPTVGSCPLFGLDRRGSLGAPPSAPGSPLGTAPDPLRTSDVLHGLFYLSRSDVSADELGSWFAPSAASVALAAGDDSAAGPWEPWCFQGLESGVGFVSSNLDRTPVAPMGSQPDNDSSSRNDDRPSDQQRALAYHHRALWPFEQAFIHSAARRFRLTHVERVAARFFQRFQRAMSERTHDPAAVASASAAAGVSSASALFPEYFLPLLSSSSVSSGVVVLRSPALGALSAEQWESRGSDTQLWTAASWHYWLAQQAQRANKAESNARSDTTATSNSLLRASRVSRCEHEPAAVLRGVPPLSRSRYCPSASSVSSAVPSVSSLSAYPASVFSCADGSALMWLAAVNDDYCDCADGSDEPGTAACAHSDAYEQTALFECTKSKRDGQSRVVQRIPVSMVDDGICDCCDGADEQHTQCADTCKK